MPGGDKQVEEEEEVPGDDKAGDDKLLDGDEDEEAPGVDKPGDDGPRFLRGNCKLGMDASRRLLPSARSARFLKGKIMRQ